MSIVLAMGGCETVSFDVIVRVVGRRKEESLAIDRVGVIKGRRRVVAVVVVAEQK